MNILNKTVLITGASTGIGKAIALAFRKKGAKVIVFGLHKPDFNCEFYKVDISKEQEIKDSLKQINKIDILINNAGIAKIARIKDATTEELNQMININIKGLFWMSKYSIPKIKDKGCIINVSSLAGIKSFEGYGIYCATKSAIISLTKTLAIELSKNKIRANSIAPGIIDTPIWKKMYGLKGKKVLNKNKNYNLLRRVGKAEEIAQTAIFLAENDFITGETISVDGGN